MFVAVVPPPQVVDHLEELLAPRRHAASFRWTVPEQWHLTLAFLADVPDRAREDLEERLARAAGRRTTTRMRVAGGGAFPHVGRAKVLWAGLQTGLPTSTESSAGTGTGTGSEDEEVRRMAVGARAAAGKAGIAVDGGRFRPHVTLARMNPPVEATSWVRLLDAYRGPAWEADRITLIASHLGEGPRRRPRYEEVAAFPLGATRRHDEQAVRQDD